MAPNFKHVEVLNIRSSALVRDKQAKLTIVPNNPRSITTNAFLKNRCLCLQTNKKNKEKRQKEIEETFHLVRKSPT